MHILDVANVYGKTGLTNIAPKKSPYLLSPGQSWKTTGLIDRGRACPTKLFWPIV